MRQTIYTLIVDNYAPELTTITLPLMQRYADKIGAEVEIISERKWPTMPVCYEKFQVRELACARGDEWSLFLDADVLVHPDLPDLSMMVPEHTVTFNKVDYSGLRFRPDDWTRRDGRNLSPGSWLVGGSRSVWSDLWAPIAGTVADALARILPIDGERRAAMAPAHLLDDYLLSRNVARFGLKVRTVAELCASNPLLNGAEFFWHQYAVISNAEKLAQMRATMERWGMQV